MVDAVLSDMFQANPISHMSPVSCNSLAVPPFNTLHRLLSSSNSILTLPAFSTPKTATSVLKTAAGTLTPGYAKRDQAISWTGKVQRTPSQVMRKLDCRYRWVGPLCIVQNDQEEQRREAVRMNFMTICIDHVCDPSR